MTTPAPTPASAWKCATCGKPATCVGAYEGATEQTYSCDVCCGHGNEDGRCKPVFPTPASAFEAWWRSGLCVDNEAQRRNNEREESFARAGWDACLEAIKARAPEESSACGCHYNDGYRVGFNGYRAELLGICESLEVRP